MPRNQIIQIISRLIALTVIFLALGAPAYGFEDARLSAASLVFEETLDGVIIRLEGPVEILNGDDRLTAESAVVTLGENMSSLAEAIERIELTGDVQYSGGGGTIGSAGRAEYIASERRIILSQGAHFTRGGLRASAGVVDYYQESQRVNLRGGCTISEGGLSASAENAEYDLGNRNGNLSGDVAVSYLIGKPVFGDEVVDEIIMRSDALYLSVAEGKVETPGGGESGRTVIEAGDFLIEADSIIFQIEESGIDSVTAEGNIILNGPDMYLSAAALSYSMSERVVHAEGGVNFLIMGQEGSAESVEVNFAEGWSIKLTGASIGGTIDEELLEREE